MAKAVQPTLSFASQGAWRKWLAANHSKSDGVWIEFAKKAANQKSVSYAEAVETALCYGWIDGHRSRWAPPIMCSAIRRGGSVACGPRSTGQRPKR